MGRVVFGIDPGKTGGLVVMTGSDRCGVKALGGGILDTTDALIVKQALVRAITLYGRPSDVWVEHSQINPRSGSKGNYSVGLSAGVIRGVLAGLGLSFGRVRSQTWQGCVLVAPPRRKGRRSTFDSNKAYTLRKERLLRAARAAWPNLPLTRKKDSGVADAAWIAWWGIVHGE